MSDSKLPDRRGRPNQDPDDDDEFNYGDTLDAAHGRAPVSSSTSARAGAVSSGVRLRNQPFDEAVDVDDDALDESVDTHALSHSHAHAGTPGRQQGRRSMDTPPSNAETSADMRGEYASEHTDTHTHTHTHTHMDVHGAPGSTRSGTSSDMTSRAHTGIMDDSDARGGRDAYRARSESVAAEEAVDALTLTHTHTGSPPAATTAAIAPGMLGIPDRKNTYNPADFSALQVPDEVRELFEYIGRYKPATIELEARLKPFVPEYIPAIGEVDPFLKPPRPDGAEELLGLTVLDEPSPNQSDPTVLDLQLRALSKKAGVEPMLVRSIENAEENPREISKWIASIADLHKTKPPPSVHYTKPMPDGERLMQEWPPAFEELLKEAQLPAADTDLSLEEYARIVCALLDVPVYDRAVVQSLHVVFSLYNDFKSNQHFANLIAEDEARSSAAAAPAPGGLA